MGRIDYKKIYTTNQDDWKALTKEPEKYENLLAGHYSESNHFVYELLQNAEDEHATKVVFEYYKDRLVFYHNGDPFDEADVIGVSSMLMGTKDRDDAQTIGRFGMGFKSVFKYTYQPEIYSDDEAFQITNYLLPVEITEKWNYQQEKASLSYPDGEATFKPFQNEAHLTKIIIPFMKREGEGRLVPISGNDVLVKLNDLTGEILLFLNHIRELYWINKSNGKYIHIILRHAESDDQLYTCVITGSDLAGKENISRYLRYKAVFFHPEMKSAEVSVAYKLNTQAKAVTEMESTPVWVYFPTRDMTDLPFLIHGSFETAVSREKLMTPSQFNDDLFDRLGDLIAESMTDLASRKLITQGFLRRVVLVAFQDEEKNGTIKGLKEKVTKVFAEASLLPDHKGEYQKRNDLVIAVPFQLADLADNTLLAKSFDGVGSFVALNGDRERNFTEYFNWLHDDIGLRIFDLADWSMSLLRMPIQRVSYNSNSEKSFTELKSIYDFLSNYPENLYRRTLPYARSGPYELAIRRCLPKAWEQLRKAPIVLNGEDDLVPAYEGDTLYIYLNPSSRYQKLAKHSVVSNRVSEQYETLFAESFHIAEFDNFQFVKENVITKYRKKESDFLEFGRTELSEHTYLEDVKLLLDLIEEYGNEQEIRKLFLNTCIVKVKTDTANLTLACPQTVYVDTSDEGIDLTVFYSPARKPDSECFVDFHRHQIDTVFFETHGISIHRLKKLGLVTSPVDEGTRHDYSGIGDDYWCALGEFCPYISIHGFDDNARFIENYSQETISRRKSFEMLKLLITISKKLRGNIRKRKTNPYESYHESWLLTRINNYNWLYTRGGEMSHPTIMSRYDLDENTYCELPGGKEAYKVLGFIEKEADAKAETFERIDALDLRDKKTLFRQLAHELGYEYTPVGQTPDEQAASETDVFDPSSFLSDEFPQRRVRDFDVLAEHVRREFYFADTTTYETVLRTIRTSRSPKENRAYSNSMYENKSGACICQMCKSIVPVEKTHILSEVTEIANFGIEMPQMNLCLCKNCAARYKQFRDGNKDKFRDEMKKAICAIDVFEPASEYTITLSPDTSVSFTQAHLAEVKEILSLLEQYGVPSKAQEGEAEPQEESNIIGPLAHPARKSGHTPTKNKGKFELQPGTKVYHKQLGEGTVTVAGGSSVTIRFKDLIRTGGVLERQFNADYLKSSNLLSIL